jgi:hypothetical protein
LDLNTNAPVALEGNLSVNSDSSMILDIGSLVSDIDGDNITLTSISASTSPAVITMSGLQMTYAANGYKGTDVILYTVSDGKYKSSNVIIVTSSFNNSLTANPTSESTQIGRSIDIDMAPLVASTVSTPLSISDI